MKALAADRNRLIGSKLYYDAISSLFREHHYRIMKPNRRSYHGGKMKKQR